MNGLALAGLLIVKLAPAYGYVALGFAAKRLAGLQEKALLGSTLMAFVLMLITLTAMRRWGWAPM